MQEGTVRAAMTAEPTTVDATADAVEVARLLAAEDVEQVRRLPVVEEGRLVGILAQADVSRAAGPTETGRMVEEISQDDGSSRA